MPYNMYYPTLELYLNTDVNDTDLKAKWIFLFGRPETNKVAQQFKDSFPIKFDGARFT